METDSGDDGVESGRSAPEPHTELPSELARLVQHVELNESGWWDSALERLLLVTVWLEGPLEVGSAAAKLETSLGAAHLRSRIEVLAAKLTVAGDLVELPSGQVKVAEEQSRSLASERAHVAELEGSLEHRIEEAFAVVDIPVDGAEAWKDFDERFLAPLLVEMGARLYEGLVDGTGDWSRSRGNSELLKPLEEKYGPAVRDALAWFLDPTVPEVREFLLRRLNAQYARDAAAVDEKVLASLAGDSNSRHTVRLFLDTNFALSVLNLHENPENESIRDLLALIDSIRERVDMKLYVLPITVDEIKSVLRDAIGRLSGWTPSRTVAAAGVSIPSSGLTRRYLEAAATAPSRSLTADAFFGPYEHDTLLFLRETGVELYNSQLEEPLRTDQRVIDDLLERQTQQASRPGGSKSYATNLHDMVLWHLVRALRSSVIESPLDAGYWVATLDFSLVGFDQVKRRRSNTSGPPTCVTPQRLIQLLRFWVPRSDLLDTALVGSFREPLLFLDFDRDAEGVTMRILRELSRFEAVDDMSPALVRRITLNKGLRARLNQSTSLEGAEATLIIESALAEEAARLEAQMAEVEAQRLKSESLATDASLVARENALRAEGLQADLAQQTADLAEIRDTAASLSEREKQARQRADDLAADLGQTQAKVADLESELRRKGAEGAAMRRAGSRSALAFLASAVLGLVCGVALLWLSSKRWIAWSVGTAVFAVATVCFAEYFLGIEDALAGSPWRRRVQSARRWLLGAAGALAVTLLGSVIFDAWKN